MTDDEIRDLIVKTIKKMGEKIAEEEEDAGDWPQIAPETCPLEDLPGFKSRHSQAVTGRVCRDLEIAPSDLPDVLQDNETEIPITIAKAVEQIRAVQGKAKSGGG